MAKPTLILAALLGVLALPPAATFADTSPNAVNNATVDDRCDSSTGGAGWTGPYDSFDDFRDATGRSCPGWEYLFYSPNQ
jgi:hypothetical protein